MILFTGASGTAGRPLLARLVAEGRRVRCLVREPRELGAHRVRVQIALGDLADAASFRHALRGVDTVIHLAAAIRDQPRGSIEELNGVATARLLRAAERAGVERFVFFSALGATEHSRSRFVRAKALAERAVAESPLDTLVAAASLIYAPGDRWLRLLERLARLPLMPVSGSGRAPFQPIWAEDVAACVVAALERGTPRPGRIELAGPETLTYDEIARTVLRAAGRPDVPLVHVPVPLARAVLDLVEAFAGTAAPATWDEAELLEIPLVSARGMEDARSLGVTPRPMSEVLGGR